MINNFSNFDFSSFPVPYQTRKSRKNCKTSICSPFGTTTAKNLSPSVTVWTYWNLRWEMHTKIPTTWLGRSTQQWGQWVLWLGTSPPLVSKPSKCANITLPAVSLCNPICQSNDVVKREASMEYIKAMWDLPERGLSKLAISATKPSIKTSVKVRIHFPKEKKTDEKVR